MENNTGAFQPVKQQPAMNNQLTLNIGLAVNGVHTHSLGKVIAVLERWKFHVSAARIHVSDHPDAPPEGEQTAVIVCSLNHGSAGTVLDRIEISAVDLEQDCIGLLRHSDGAGFLVGPNPYAGGFNPEYFIPWESTELVPA